MQIITTAVTKGGAGKTSTSAALLQAAAYNGKRCLAIDMDLQSNLSFFLSADTNHSGSRELLNGQEAQEVLQTTPQGIDVIVGNPDLATEVVKPGSSYRLREAIEPIKKEYDLIIIDTPPQIGELTYNALMAATGLLIPLEADNSSLQGLYNIIDITQQVQKANPELQIIGTVITRYDARPKLNRFFLEAIQEAGAETGAPFLKAIRQSIAVKEAQAMQRSLFDYAPKCTAAQDYMDLLKMID